MLLLRALAVTVVLAATACTDASGSGEVTARDLVESWADAAGYTPALPVDPPDGYTLVFAGSTFAGAPGQTMISLCTRPVGDDSRGSCSPGSEDGQPWFMATTLDGGSEVVVTTVSEPFSADDLALWRDLAFTDDLQSLAWLDRPLGQ